MVWEVASGRGREISRPGGLAFPPGALGLDEAG
jgi:hypothetical protein